MRAVWRAIRGNLRSHKGQRALVFLTLTAAALLLALALTAYFAGYRVYDRLLERTHGAHIWLSVPGKQISPDELRRIVRTNPEVVEATEPMATFHAFLEAPNGEKETVLVRDFDPQRKIARLLWVEGRAPKAHTAEIALDRNLARALGVRLGDKVKLGLGKTPRTFTVTGTFITSEFCAYPGCRPPRVYLAPGTLAAALQKAHSTPETWDVGVRIRHPERAEAVLRELRRALPPGTVEGYTWLEVRRYAGFGQQMVSVFLLAFAVMALLVAGFLITNAVGGAIRAQTRQIGLLRAVGFTNGQLMEVYLGEYLLVGLVASLVGVVSGVPLAARLFARLAEQYAVGMLWPPLWVLPVALLALVAAVALAAAWPLRHITRLDTVTAIRRGMEPPRRRPVRLLRLPFPVAYGLTGLLSTPLRSALTALGLAVGALAITVALSLVATVRVFEEDPIGMGLVPAADVTVWVENGLTPDDFLAALRAFPEVSSYACQTRIPVRVQGEDRDLYPRLVCGDVSLFANMLLEGRLPQTNDEAAAAYTIAHEHGWHVGDRVTLLAQGKTYAFRLVGIYRDTDNLGQMFILPARAFTDRTPPLFYVRLKPGTDPYAFLNALKARFGDRVDGKALKDAFKDDPSGQGVGHKLRTTVTALAVVLGLLTALGVLGSLSLSVAEERRTVGILKALGMTPGQVAAAVMSAAVALALVGYVVGTPLGAVAAKALFNALGGVVGLGPIPVPLDGRGMALLLPGMVVMAALGAYLPARRAARLPVVEVLREE